MADYLSSTPEGNCIFCKIISGEISTPGIFWEDESHLAFLSLWPNTIGYTVVVPKFHYPSDVMGLPDDVLAKFILASKKVSQILLNHFDDVGRVGVMMEGTGVDHAHIKLFPMHGTGHMKNGEWKQYHSTNETFFNRYEGYFSSNDGPKASEDDIRKLAQKLRENPKSS